MDQFKRIGEVCRQHYEKIVLIVVLLIMAAAAYVMYGQSQEKRREVESKPAGFERRTVAGVKPVNLQPIENSIKAASTPPPVDLGGRHLLFNSVRWLQYPSGERQKVESSRDIGLEKTEVAAIRPLLLTLTYVRALISGTGDQRTVTGYQLVVTNDAIIGPKGRVSQYMGVNETNRQIFVLTEVKGPPEAPTELVARLKDFGGATATFTTNKPYVRVVGYEADLKYTLTSEIFSNKRKDATIVIEGESYNIVDITENTVVMLEKSNGKRHTIRLTTPP